MNFNISTNEYHHWLEGIKLKIKTAQLKVAISTNAQLIELYWDLAKDILQKQKESTWGDAVLEQLSVDLRLSFPEINGFSRRNLYAVRQWYLFYSSEFEFVPQPVAQIEPGRLIWAIEGAQMTATQPPNNPIQVTSTCDGMAI